MSAIDDLFVQLRSENRKAFMPFVTAGDPDLRFTADVIRELDRRGCSLCEVGIPYSDPIADGPVIQASYTRALQNQVRTADIFTMLGETIPDVSMPLVTMVSYAIIFRMGPEKYIERAQQAGVAGAIVPDLLADEADELVEICKRRDFSLIHLVTPTTSRERALQIASKSTGFLYYVSITGITGERNTVPEDLVQNLKWLREQTSLPICVGFGISRPEHVRTLSPVCDGVIVGSAMVRHMADVESRGRNETVQNIGLLAEQLMAGFD